MLALYLENQRLDTDESLQVSFTYETLDPNRLSSIKNSFSKTVAIKGTPNNNRIFGHIFRFDKYIPVDIGAPDRRIGSYFDPHRQTRWTMTNNGIYVNSGYCTLDNIIRKGNDITYNITLYGGIGGFFYNLKYNSDGSERSLSDLFWNWRPRTSLNSYGDPLDPASEATDTILRCSSDIIASSYRNLNPDNPYEGTTAVDKDVTFVPCYRGLYDDFDSKAMLVSTYNQESAYVPADVKTKLQQTFPISLTSDGTMYYALDKNLDPRGMPRFGVATFSRDIDPSEAGDLRVSELPVAVRLSKMMTVISNPDNNGGYEVEWSPSIKSSYHWNYGWVMLGDAGKTQKIVDNVSFTAAAPVDITATYVSSNDTVSTTNTPYAMTLTSSSHNLPVGTYYFTATMHPKAVAKCSLINPGEFNNMFSGQMYSINAGGTAHQRIVWNTAVIVHRIYTDSSLGKLLATKASVFYYTQNDNLGIGKTINGDVISRVKGSIAKRLSTMYSVNLTGDDIFVHQCKADTFEPVASNGTININLSYDDVETRFKVVTQSELTDITVTQEHLLMFTVFQAVAGSTDTVNSGLYPKEKPDDFSSVFAGPDYSNGSMFSIYNYNGTYHHSYWNDQNPGSSSSDFEFNITLKSPTTIAGTTTAGWNVITLDKKRLFASSKTPYDYIVGFCKLMNYRITYDDVNMKVKITPADEFYVRGNAIPLEDRIDYIREMSISPIVTKYHKVRLALNTPQTYPVSLFDKISTTKFNEVAFDTGVNTSTSETNLLDGLVFDNVIDWQQSSVFHNHMPQVPNAALSPTVSWRLFNPDASTGDITNTKEFIRPGYLPLGTLPNIDFLPKVALFDKDNKKADISSSLIFLNGFVRNYDYTLPTEKDGASKLGYFVSPKVMLSDDSNLQYYLNGKRCYVYDFTYNGDFRPWGYYSGRGTAASWVMPFFSRDLYNRYVNGGWVPSSSLLASWNIAYQPALENVYDLANTVFIKKTDYFYATELPNQPTDNEYTIDSIPTSGSDSNRIYDRCWGNTLADTYDRNTRNVTLYVDITGLGDANAVMSRMYSWHSSLWTITKIHNYRIGDRFDNDKFTKVTLHKVMDTNYLS